MAIVWDKSFSSSKQYDEFFKGDVRIVSRKLGKASKDKVICAFNPEADSMIGVISKSGYMHVGIDMQAGRLYFDEDPLRTDRRVNTYKDGYDRKGRERRMWRYITLGYPSLFDEWVGDYDFMYDEEARLYYIDKDLKAGSNPWEEEIT